MLLHKAKRGEIIGFAFVGIKRNGVCAGAINIMHRQDEALGAAVKLSDAILNREPFIERQDRPSP